LGSQEGSQVGDVDEEEAEDETICLVRRRRRLDLLEEVVANSSSASEEEFEMANTSGIFGLVSYMLGLSAGCVFDGFSLCLLKRIRCRLSQCRGCHRAR
jgi:hypothetical protein